ncbi:MAG: right-handed parallel beta-helix repeat-containing protein [Allorhizobium sp.]
MKSFGMLAAPVTAAAVLTIASAEAAEVPVFVEVGGAWQEESQSGFGFMLPFQVEPNGLFFIDLDAALQEGDVKRTSLGAGYRFDAGGGLAIGLNGYYDFLNSSLDNNFHQLSLGAEIFGPVAEARANAYIPLGDGESVDGAGSGVISGGALRFREGREQARPGADVEVGVKVPGISDDGSAQLKLFAGSYWYGGKNVSDMFGAKLRAELAFGNLEGLPSGSTLSFGAAATYDNEDKLDGALMVNLRIPFGASEDGRTPEPFDPMMQSVHRASAIKTHVGATGDLEDAVLDLTGAVAGNVVTIDAADGDATATNALLASAGQGAVILTDGDILLQGSLALGENQVLLGGGGVLAVHGASSGGAGLFRNRGEATTLTGQNAALDVVTMASGSAVSSLAVTGGLAGIGSTGSSDLLIDNVDIYGTAHDGIRLSGVNGATIQNSRIHDLYICENSTLCEFSIFDPNSAPYAAVSAHGTRNLTVRDTIIENVTYGVFAGSAIDDSGWPPVITQRASDIVLDDVTIRNSRREGVLLVGADDVTLNAVTVDNSAQDRDMDLVVIQGTSDVLITDMTLKGGINGLMLVRSTTLPDDAQTTNIRVDGLSVEATSNAGIFFNPVSDISLKDVTISNAGTYGMFIYGDEWGFLGGPVKDLSFDNVVVDNAASAGLYLMGPSENLDGEITVRNSPRDCKSDPSWLGGLSGSITQSDGSLLLVNDAELGPATFDGRCG